MPAFGSALFRTRCGFAFWLICVLGCAGLDAHAARFAVAQPLTNARAEHTATLRADGTLLVVGGVGTSTPADSAETYDPHNAVAGTAALLAATGHTATVLRDGSFLLAGGSDIANGAALAQAQRISTLFFGAPSPPSMATARFSHTATLLPDGRLLVVGGAATGGAALAAAEIFNPASNQWAPAAAMAQPRRNHTAVLLADGRVLVAGGRSAGGALAGAEIYNPATNAWTTAAPLADPRSEHTATVLADGSVLVAGGTGSSAVLASVERFVPASGTWVPVAAMANARVRHSATLLPDGRLLVAGGFDGTTNLAQVGFFDPATGAWSAATLAEARSAHSANLLPNGRVLFIGGRGNGPGSAPITSVEYFDPTTARLDAAATLGTARGAHTATLLPDGQVLLTGGYGPGVAPAGAQMASTELYDPVADAYRAGPPMVAGRWRHTASLLNDGRVLVAGGVVQAERYDPPSNSWSPAGTTSVARQRHTATVLPDGRVLLVGGSVNGVTTASVEAYDPATNSWTTVAPMGLPRQQHATVLLPDGTVLVTGGRSSAAAGSQTNTAELYDPVADQWSAVPSMATIHFGHTATVVRNDYVFNSYAVVVAGGAGAADTPSAVAESFDSTAWTTLAPLPNARIDHSAVVSRNDDLLVIGGRSSGGMPVSGVERYDFTNRTWVHDADLAAPRTQTTATVLHDGRVLIAGGLNATLALASSVRYDRGLNIAPPRRPVLTTAALPVSAPVLALSGSGLLGDSEAGSGGMQASTSNQATVLLRHMGSGFEILLRPLSGSATGYTGEEQVDPFFGTTQLAQGFYLATAYVNGIASVSRSVLYGPAVQSIAWSAAPAPALLVGGTATPAATASSGLPTVVASATPAVCTWAGGTVTGVAQGTCRLTADQAGDSNFAPAPQRILVFAVARTSQTITGLAAIGALQAGGTTALSATASSGLAVVFASATPAVCTVTGASVQGVAVGSCTLTADQPGNATFDASPQQTLTLSVGVGGTTAPGAAGTPGAASAAAGGGAWVFAPAGNGPLESAFFIPTTGHPKSPPTQPPGYAFPQGLFDFVLVGGTPGTAGSVTITYPQPLPPGSVYMKYGRTTANPASHWYAYPATISGATVTLLVTDGGSGDDDRAVNGSIADPGGPAVPLAVAGAITAVPTLGDAALWLLSLGLGAVALRRVQRQQQRVGGV